MSSIGFLCEKANVFSVDSFIQTYLWFNVLWSNIHPTKIQGHGIWSSVVFSCVVP